MSVFEKGHDSNDQSIHLQQMHIKQLTTSVFDE